MARSNVYTLSSQENGCARCGDTFEPRETGGRPQRICEPACRVAYHKARAIPRSLTAAHCAGGSTSRDRFANLRHSAIVAKTGGGVIHHKL